MDDERKAFLERVDFLNRLFDRLCRAGLGIAAIGWLTLLVLGPVIGVPPPYAGIIIWIGAAVTIFSLVAGFALPFFEGFFESRSKPRPRRRLTASLANIAEEALGISATLCALGAFGLALSGELFVILNSGGLIVAALTFAVFYILVFIWCLYYHWR